MHETKLYYHSQSAPYPGAKMLRPWIWNEYQPDNSRAIYEEHNCTIKKFSIIKEN